jgi:hypothetical protein
MPCPLHLSKRCVPVTLGKALELPHVSDGAFADAPAPRPRLHGSGVLAQLHPVINGRARHFEGLVRFHLAHPAIY